MEKELNSYFQELLDTKRIPGCALRVRRHGELIYDRCFGVYDLAKAEPVTENTVYRLASMTKLITAAAVMKLVEDGVLSLNDNLVKFFPDYPEEKKRVRIRHLLNHSSSLGTPGGKGEAYLMEYFRPGVTLEERITDWAQMPFDCELGETAKYSAVVNFDTLGRIIEVASGMSCEEYYRKAILDPLGMKDTSFNLREDMAERLAAVYNSKDGVLTEAPEVAMIDALTKPSPSYQSGSGGLYSTLADYDRFTTMLAGGGILDGVRILKEETLRLMRTPRQITDEETMPGCPWGLGFMIFEHPERSGIFVAPGTYGWSGAFGTHMFVNEETGLSATFMVSMADLGGADSPISRQIEKIVFGL